MSPELSPCQLLADWLANPSHGKGSLTLYLLAAYGGIRMEWPAHVAASLREAMDAILPCRRYGRDPAPGDRARRRPPGLSLPSGPHPSPARFTYPREDYTTSSERYPMDPAAACRAPRGCRGS